MPRYTWKLGGDEAHKQWANLPEDTRRLVNRRIEELLENPLHIPGREYDARRDLHLIPIGKGKGYIQYAVAGDARLVIVYRFPPRRLD